MGKLSQGHVHNEEADNEAEHCEVASAARAKVGTTEYDTCTVVCEDTTGSVKTTYTYTVYRE